MSVASGQNLASQGNLGTNEKAKGSKAHSTIGADGGGTQATASKQHAAEFASVFHRQAETKPLIIHRDAHSIILAGHKDAYNTELVS